MEDRMLGFAQIFGFFGRDEISIFLVFRTISDGFPLNPTYKLFVPEGKAGGQGISIAVVIHLLDSTLQGMLAWDLLSHGIYYRLRYPLS